MYLYFLPIYINRSGDGHEWFEYFSVGGKYAKYITGYSWNEWWLSMTVL